MIFLRGLKPLVIGVVIGAVVVGFIIYWFSINGGMSVNEIIENVPNNIKLSSPVFVNNSYIPQKYTCDSTNLSPPLNWSSVPSGTKSLAILVYDPDAPHGTFYHWLIYGIRPSLNGLPAGVPKKIETPYGKQGINSFREIGYGGPCPPRGEVHHYIFLILAVNYPKELRAGLTPQEFLNIVRDHIIGYGLLVGLYGR